MAWAGKADTIEAMAADKHKHCDNCGYDLTGLAVVGDCPECGYEYGSWADAGVKHPRPRQPVRPSWIARHARSVLLVMAAMPVLFCSRLLSWGTENDYVWHAGLALAFLILLGAAISYLFERAEW